jgi:multidrug efflux system membrane fusion protein
MDPVYADFAVTEAALSAVQRHMGRKAPQAQVRIPDEPGEPRLGELTFLDNAVQESTGTVMLRATVPNPDRRLWPGRYVKIRLILDVLEAAVLVPAEAPQMSAKGPFVYVVKDDLTAELRPVRLGQRQEERVIIQEGLQSGERVITVGHIGVMPGGKVRIDEPRPAGAGPAPQEPGN